MLGESELAPRAGRVADVLSLAGRRNWTRERLVEGVRGGDPRAVARAISLVENSDPLAAELVRELYPQTGHAYAIGVTGPPGVGKSSLIAALLPHVRAQGLSVGVVSVDPSSPFSQGALLGDRIRLADHFLDPGVFIRSMGTRGHLGGLAEATLQAVLLLDAAGKDVVFVETVGTGQSEVEVIGIADTVLLVLMPGLGRLDPGAEGGDHGDPGRDRREQDGQPGREDDADRGALDPRPRSRSRLAAADRPHRGCARREPGAAVERDRRARAFLEQDGRLEERRRRNLAQEVFAVASARAKAHLERAVERRRRAAGACSTRCSAGSSIRCRPCTRSSTRSSTSTTGAASG